MQALCRRFPGTCSKPQPQAHRDLSGICIDVEVAIAVSSKRHSAIFALQAQVRTTLPVNIGSVAEDQRRGQFPEEQGGGRRLRHHQRVLPDLILIPLPGNITLSVELRGFQARIHYRESRQRSIGAPFSVSGVSSKASSSSSSRVTKAQRSSSTEWRTAPPPKTRDLCSSVS